MLSLQEIKYLNAYVWWAYSLITIIPLFLLSVYKLMKPINIHKYHDKNPFPQFKQDKIARVFLFWAPIYYFFDSITTFLIGDINSCSVSFTFHHIVSLIFLPIVISQNYYPWFLCFVPFLHAVLLAFPDKPLLNYIYLFGCALYQYGLYQDPYGKMKSYKLLQFGTWVLEISLVMLWGFGCSNRF